MVQTIMSILEVYESIIRENDTEAFKKLWRVGEVGGRRGGWRDFYRVWMQVKKYPTLWKDHYTKPITKQHRISVCTVAMNRVKDIMQTLPLNIEDSKNYPVEFILLDYGSKDGLKEWIKENMMEHIELGLLKFYSLVNKVKYFSHTHSRNLAFKLATGDVITNFDADNYMKDGFLETINIVANHIPKKMVVVKSGRTHGNVSFYKDDFFKLGGYNEELKGRAPVAYHLQLRALESGFTLGYYKRKRGKVDNGYEITANFESEDYGQVNNENTFRIYMNIMQGKLVANKGRYYGKGVVIENFNREIVL